MSSNKTNTTSTSLEHCSYNAGDIVTCNIRAATAIGFGPTTNVTIEVECDSKFVKIYLMITRLKV